MYIHQLFENGKTKGFDQLFEQYGLNIMQVNSLLSAIPNALKNYYVNAGPKCKEKITVSPVKKTYQKLIEDPRIMMDKIKAWEKDLGYDINYNVFVSGFSDLYKVTNIPKFRSFQYRLLTRVIITNVHLEHWGLKPSNMCSFCEMHKKSYVHLFIYCEKV